MTSIPDKLFEYSAGLALDARRRDGVRTAFVDTAAVMYAGWNEPVTEAIRRAYDTVDHPLAHGGTLPDPEHAALVWGTAAHALDFDDVHMTSVTHPSAVLIPAILTMARTEGTSRARQASAYIVGLATSIALGEALGPGHYSKGWHATSTIGPIAAAAALGHMLEFDERHFRFALSLAVSQAAGTQCNFGSMAKPVHAGLAAAGGVRAARLASNGVNAAKDAFGEKGFLDLYSGDDKDSTPENIVLVDDVASLSRKLYPCCYMAHRPIGAAIDLNRTLNGQALNDPLVSVVVRTPYGCTKALRVHRPTTGLEAKFSGEFAVAAALLEGRADLSIFQDDTVARTDLRNLAERVTLVEDSLDGRPAPTGIDHGVVRVLVERAGETLAEAEAAFYPGSPNLPATEDQLSAKVEDCLYHFGRHGGDAIATAEISKAARRFAGLENEGV